MDLYFFWNSWVFMSRSWFDLITIVTFFCYFFLLLNFFFSTNLFMSIDEKENESLTEHDNFSFIFKSKIVFSSPIFKLKKNCCERNWFVNCCETAKSSWHIAYRNAFLSFPFWFHCLVLVPVRLVRPLSLAQQSNNPVQCSRNHKSNDLYSCKPANVHEFNDGKFPQRRFGLLTPWP